MRQSCCVAAAAIFLLIPLAPAAQPAPTRPRATPASAALLAADVEDVAADEASWARIIEKNAQLPGGFTCATTSLTFSPRELPDTRAAMDLGAIVLDEPTDLLAGVFTRNKLCGAPVTLGRALVALREPRVQCVLTNNKVSNVRPGPGLGEACALEVTAAAAAALGLAPGARVAPASTGVIGWALPVGEMVAAAGRLVARDATAASVARAMMTTDRYAKAARAELPGGATVVGVAKGAGMIEPSLGTMLCFLLTDADVPRDALQAALGRCTAGTLGSCGVDGDESTSDMCLLLSSGRRAADTGEFEAALGRVLAQLAHHVVRNGEGTNHVLRVAVRGDTSAAAARELGRALVNGPLLKCAVAGEDPNVGRLVGRLGQLLGARDAGAPLLDEASPVAVRLGGETIFERGAFALDATKEARLAAHLRAARLGADDPAAPRCPAHGACVEVEVDLGGDPDVLAVVLGSDLTHERRTARERSRARPRGLEIGTASRGRLLARSDADPSQVRRGERRLPLLGACQPHVRRGVVEARPSRDEVYTGLGLWVVPS